MEVTPAEELTAAADRLDQLGSSVPEGPWEADGRCVWGLVGVSAWQRDVVFVGDGGEGGAATPRVADYIAAMNPIVGKALAEWLRRAARAASEQMLGWDAEAVVLARLINGGETHG